MEKAAMKSVSMMLVVFVATAATWGARAQGLDEHEGHIAVNVSDLAWSPATGLPPGAEIAVIEGNPGEEGPFTLRVRTPDGYTVAPHWHPGVEHVTVLAGQFNIGMGETMDREMADTLMAGGFAVMQPEVPHYAWTTGETILQLHGVGPWDITYVNPDDDPRQAAP